jgi:hypothetical protein
MLIPIYRIQAPRIRSEKLAREYAELMRAGSEPPPIEISTQGGPHSIYRYKVEDGAHRWRAHVILRRGHIHARVVEPSCLFVR